MKRRHLLAAGLALACVPSVAVAHPYHTSSAVADVRRRRLEVTLSVTPEDLQEALRRHAKRALDVDTDSDVDALAEAYILGRFEVMGEDGPLTPTWIGSEIEDDVARLYFEFRLPKDPSTVKVRNTVFFELAPAQINRVLVRQGKDTRTLRFRAGDEAKALL
ncbi:MAG: DUF6702 family protein [Nannocystaceae bacterium]|nr:hypothetical protein [bacterium]